MACTSKLDILDGRGAAPIARERLHVLHINHHLRGEESDGDEAFVRDLCAQYGLPLCVEHAFFDHESGNIEAAAREVRYAAARRFVRELCTDTGAPRTAARICTAHTSSDRAETFLMNAIKGSGPAGLSSIPRRRNIVVRPLLDLTHDELVSYLQVHGQPWREDESNEDVSYLRNYVRHRVMPVVAQRNANVCKTIGAACEILGDEDAFLSQLSAQAFRSCLRKEAAGALVLDARRLAAAEVVIARRMVRLAIKRIDPDARPEMRHVERVLACVAAGTGSVTLPAGIDARVEFGMLAFKAPAAREGLVADWISVPGRLSLGVDAAALGFADHDSERMLAGLRGEIPSEARSARLWVDSPVPGDVMCPLGMSGRSKKVSALLNEARIPVSERSGVPVVRTAPGGAVVWVAGVRADERFKCTAATRVAYLLRVVDAE
jgi:tRNA(Ile)-lysidine synthase